MPIRIYKLAEVVESHVLLERHSRFSAGDIAAALTNLDEITDPAPGDRWTLDLVIGDGPAARKVVIDLPTLLPQRYNRDAPFFLGPIPENNTQVIDCLVYFRGRLFASTRRPTNETDREEICLRVKKAVYEEDRELSSLRAAVADFEAAIQFQKTGPKREPVPEHVKLVVWARDGGACARCGSKKDLHFDHIIPVAKGGGNSEANIQILCQTCNLAKSDKMAL